MGSRALRRTRNNKKKKMKSGIIKEKIRKKFNLDSKYYH